jgi:hypothetical protein
MITLNVNGKERQVDREPDTPLLWAVRDAVGFRRRQPTRRPPPARIRPGRPAPRTGPGTLAIVVLALLAGIDGISAPCVLLRTRPTSYGVPPIGVLQAATVS